MRIEVGVRCKALLARNACQPVTEIGLLLDELFISTQEFPRPPVAADGWWWVCGWVTPIGNSKPTPNATPRLNRTKSPTIKDKQCVLSIRPSDPKPSQPEKVSDFRATALGPAVGIFSRGYFV